LGRKAPHGCPRGLTEDIGHKIEIPRPPASLRVGEAHDVGLYRSHAANYFIRRQHHLPHTGRSEWRNYIKRLGRTQTDSAADNGDEAFFVPQNDRHPTASLAKGCRCDAGKMKPLSITHLDDSAMLVAITHSATLSISA
jgi:hypothetical protein